MNICHFGNTFFKKCILMVVNPVEKRYSYPFNLFILSSVAGCNDCFCFLSSLFLVLYFFTVKYLCFSVDYGIWDLQFWVDIAYMSLYLKKDSYWLTWHDIFQNMLFCFIGILKIITDNFLPHMNHLTLEQTFFSQILPKVQLCVNLNTIEDIKIWS